MQSRIIFYIFIAFISAHSAEWSFRGQASALGTGSFEVLDRSQIGLQYIPEASLAHPIGENHLLDAAISANTSTSYRFDQQQGESKLDMYRLWLRWSGSQYEARLGLQQIKFGPGMILRPLMWFDRIDPRDALQFSKGVYAGLFRYYFINNANIWLWSVLGRSEAKGLELVASEDNKIEYGARLQYPMQTGELAITYYHRTADINSLFPDNLSFNLDPAPEHRFALDGKWDIAIGLWFEAVVMQKEITLPYPIPGLFSSDAGNRLYSKYLMVGADYTLGLGNGLHILGEHMIMDLSDQLDRVGERYDFSAVLADYPISLWDMCMAIIYYDWEHSDWYNYITWRRTYDNWSINAGLFWNPENPSFIGRDTSNIFIGAGRGFQIMLIYNH